MAEKVNKQLDLQQIALLRFVLETLSSAPGTPVNGRSYYDSTALRTKVYENGGWANGSQTGSELLANKGAASGYASLDSGTKVPIAQVPTGQTGSTVPLGNDARFSDTRTPTAGSVVLASLAASMIDQAAGTASARTLAYTATTAMPGNARLDQIAVPTSSVSMNGQRLTSLPAPGAGSDPATKTYVDDAIQGFKGVKDPARVAVLTNVNLASPGSALDGITMNAGERFLAPAQTTTTERGLYIWNGAASAATRSPDADATGEIQDGTTVAIAEGTSAGSIFIQRATPAGAPGAWSQDWAVYSSGGVTYTGSNGILLTGSNFTAVKDTTDATNPIAIGANGIKVNTIPIDHGGTGQVTAALALAALGGAKAYTGLMGAITAGGNTTVTHNLNTLDTIESFRVVATGAKETFQVVDATVNTLTVTSEVAINANDYRVTVVGF